MKYNIINEYKRKAGNINIKHIKELTKNIPFKPNSIECDKNILYKPIFYQYDEEGNEIPVYWDDDDVKEYGYDNGLETIITNDNLKIIYNLYLLKDDPVAHEVFITLNQKEELNINIDPYWCLNHLHGTFEKEGLYTFTAVQSILSISYYNKQALDYYNENYRKEEIEIQNIERELYKLGISPDLKTTITFEENTNIFQMANQIIQNPNIIYDNIKKNNKTKTRHI